MLVNNVEDGLVVVPVSPLARTNYCDIGMIPETNEPAGEDLSTFN